MNVIRCKDWYVCIEKVIEKEDVTVCKSLINPFPNKPWFLHVCTYSLLKTLWEKEKLLKTSNFSFSHSVFCPFRGLSSIFIKIQNCPLQTLSVWKSPKSVVWERVKVAVTFF